MPCLPSVQVRLHLDSICKAEHEEALLKSSMTWVRDYVSVWAREVLCGRAPGGFLYNLTYFLFITSCMQKEGGSTRRGGQRDEEEGMGNGSWTVPSLCGMFMMTGREALEDVKMLQLTWMIMEVVTKGEMWRMPSSKGSLRYTKGSTPRIISCLLPSTVSSSLFLLLLLLPVLS